MMKYDSRLITAMRNYFDLLKESRCMSMNGYYPVAHEMKIRSVLRNARRILQLQDTVRIKELEDEVRAKDNKIAELRVKVEAGDALAKAVDKIQQDIGMQIRRDNG
ncbi:MAG: hypothetical protein ACTSX2_04020 [Candidatus Thorarchaeota archaeon]